MGKLKVAVLSGFSCRFYPSAPITKEEFIPASGSGVHLESKTDFNFETEWTRFPGTGSLTHTVTAPLFLFFRSQIFHSLSVHISTTTVLGISSCSYTSHDNNPSLHKFPHCVYSDPGISALLSVHQRMLGKPRRRRVRRDRRGLRWFVVCGDLPSLLFLTQTHTLVHTPCFVQLRTNLCLSSISWPVIIG